MNEKLKLAIRARIFTMPLYDCGLSVRATNVLSSKEFTSIGDLFATPSSRSPLTVDEMTYWRNCGKKTKGEITELINDITKILP